MKEQGIEEQWQQLLESSCLTCRHTEQVKSVIYLLPAGLANSHNKTSPVNALTEEEQKVQFEDGCNPLNRHITESYMYKS